MITYRQLRWKETIISKTYLPIFPQEKMDNCNSSYLVKNTKLILKILQTKKAPGLNHLTTQFFQTFKEDIISLLFNLF